MNDLKNVTAIVKDVLEDNESTRNNDDKLYVLVCTKINPYCFSYPFFYTHSHRKEIGLPGFETVRRARQKLQQKYPELRGSERVQRKRAKREEEFREYARSEV